MAALADWELYRDGRLLAHAGYYHEALAALDAIRDKDDAMILTMIGYSKRKLGAVDEGIAYYHRALAINPDSVNTREYLGEGYVSDGPVRSGRGRVGEDRDNLRDRLRSVCPARVGYCRRVGIAPSLRGCFRKRNWDGEK